SSKAARHRSNSCRAPGRVIPAPEPSDSSISTRPAACGSAKAAPTSTSSHRASELGGTLTNTPATNADDTDARIGSLTRIVEDLRGEVGQLKARAPEGARPGPAGDETLDRRRMLKGAGLAAAAGAAALVVVGKPSPSGALNPTLTLDQSNTANAGTELKS